MEILYEMKSSLLTILPPSLWDILDIAVLAYLIYKLMTFVRETRAGGLMKGVVVLFAAYLVAKLVQMKAIAFIMEKAFDVGILAIVILFQPELRRTLERIGQSRLSKIPVIGQLGGASDPYTYSDKWERAITAICDACEHLSATTTGALIVIERETRLGEQIISGTIMDAIPTKELFGNIFYTKTPLHDGAVIMRDGLIHAAACYLPPPAKTELINKELGSRHRAAIGMSENSDAVIIVVSEETGTISVAENGNIERGFSKDTLKTYLNKKIVPEKPQKKPALENAKQVLKIGSTKPKKKQDK